MRRVQWATSRFQAGGHSGWKWVGACAVLLVSAAGLVLGDAFASGVPPGESARALLSRTRGSESAGVLEAREHASRLLATAAREGTPADVRRTLEQAALEWATLAVSWERTSAAEAAASEQEMELGKLRRELKGARALLEETESRRSRAEGLLLELRRNGAVAPAPTPDGTPNPPEAP